MAKDNLFIERKGIISDFNFNKDVALVFDDMLGRSIPFYEEIQRMVIEMSIDFAEAGTNIYDLGCSTGTTLLNLNKFIGNKLKYIGVDYSQDMLDKCREKFTESNFQGNFELICEDLNKGLYIENASVVIMVLTLQFVRPLYREKIIKSIVNGLNPNGCLILVEKVLAEDSLFNRLFIKYYYDMKRRNGYSETEIALKREAIENVLVPYTLKENRELMISQGFRHCDVFFKWYNFCGMVAVK